MEETQESEQIIPAAMDAEQHMVAAVLHIMKALEARRNLGDDMNRVLSDLGAQLSTMAKLNESDAESTKQAECVLKCAQKRILNFRPNRFRIWDSGHEELSEYLEAIREVQRLRESLESVPAKRDKKLDDLVNQAQQMLQIAMEKLQEVLVTILHQNKQFFEQDCMSFHSCEENFSYEESTVLTEDDSTVGSSRRESSSSTEPEEFRKDIIHPDVVPYLKSIAEVMFSLHYDQEFCQAFISFWRYALDEYLTLLNVEQHGIEDILKMEWDSLSSKIKTWCQAAKSIFGFYLVSEKRLFDQVLGEVGSVSSTCFIEATKASLLCLLNFGQAVALGPLRPERIFGLLDMNEVLATHLEDLNASYAEEAGSYIRTEFHKLLHRLGHSAKVIYLDLGDQVASNTSTVPYANGGIPHLTKYVMNYMTLLVEYGNTLNSLLEEQENGNPNPTIAGEIQQNISSCISSPLANQMRSVTSILEAKLDEKSNLYENNALKHIFMMNNIHYMVQKIKHQKLRQYFGDEWIKEHIVKFKKHARSYERVTWSSLLSWLKDDGTKAKAILKERCRSFSVAFEEICKIQRGWFIPDPQLRQDLRISTSQTVINAYRAFVSRITASSVCEKHIKYTVEQLENHILDLFDGSQKTMSHQRRR